MLILTKS